MKLEMKDPVHVIATGGMASLVCLECAVVDRVGRPDHDGFEIDPQHEPLGM